MFLYREWTSPIWFAELGYVLNKGEIRRFDEWLAGVVHHCELTKELKIDFLQKIGYVRSHIWKERCSATVEKFLPQPERVLHKIRRDVANFIKFTGPGKQRKLVSRVSSQQRNMYDKWFRPRSGFVKLNCDAAWREDDFSTGIGVVARNDSGKLVGGFQNSFKCDSVSLAEGLAIVDSIMLAKSSKWRSVVLETDFAEVFYGLQNARMVPWRLKPIVDEVRANGVFFMDLQLSLVKRNANAYADLGCYPL